MAVINQFQLPVTFAEYQEATKILNPELKLPPGCLYHFVTEENGITTITNVWEDEAQADTFFRTAAEVTGMPPQKMNYKQIKEIIA